MQLSSFLTYVKQDFKRTDKDTEIIQALNDMINYISVLIPHSGYKFQSWVQMVAGQEDYPIPTLIQHFIHPARLLEGSASGDSGYPLDFISKEEYDLEEPNPNRTSPSTGEPDKYTIYSRSILLTPIPDKSTYILEINWTKKPTTLAADADTHSLGSEWDEVIKYGVLERINAGIGLLEDAQYWSGKYKDPYGNPIGMLKNLLDKEKDLEGSWIGSVRNNSL